MSRFHISLVVAFCLVGCAAGAKPLASSAPGAGQAAPQPKANQAVLQTSTDRITISTFESYTVTNTFLLWNGSAAPQNIMTYLISENITWLSVSPSSGFVSSSIQTISVVISAGTLATGTYSGTITIDAIDSQTGIRALGAPKNIVVTLIVLPRKPVNFEKPQISGTLFVGQTASAWPGLWQNANSLVFSYQWQMANDKYGGGLIDMTNNDGSPITTTYCVIPQYARAKFLRIRVTATDLYPTPLSTTAYSDFSNARRVNAAPADFSGDGKTDLWLFNAASGTWRVSFYTNNEATVVFGNSACQAVPADYDGDGKADPAIYDTSSGLWSVMLSASGYASASVRFGGSGYTPIPADFDGDGKTDPATYHQASGVISALLSDNSHLPASVDIGGSGYQAVTGDFDGDGKADPAVYQSATGLWLIMLSGSDYFLGMASFGGPDYLPVPGDYDGDSKADLGVYWPAGNWWWVRSSQTGVVRNGTFGSSSGACAPAAGYYDTDPYCDPVTIQVTGDFMVWGIMRSLQGYRGQSYQFSTDYWRVSW